MASSDDPNTRSTAPTGIVGRQHTKADPSIVSGDDDSPTANHVVRAERREELVFSTVDPQRYEIGLELARGGMGRILEGARSVAAPARRDQGAAEGIG